MQKVIVKSHLVEKTEWKQTEEQTTDGQTDGADYFTFLAQAVGKILVHSSNTCLYMHSLLPREPNAEALT